MITESYDRTWNAARRQQGFRTREDFEAFMRYFDHTEECAECQKPGVLVAIDDGYQPTQNRCEQAKAMFEHWLYVHDAAA